MKERVGISDRAFFAIVGTAAALFVLGAVDLVALVVVFPSFAAGLILGSKYPAKVKAFLSPPPPTNKTKELEDKIKTLETELEKYKPKGDTPK
jgi:hypothetical protein